ncbi:uncharacterized protein LOC126798903 isoform X2 [Argentina anserina]|uniref:uncharacterized protein LOC126798903 isoform X2 n=1 Tax=Argentina anserina TaxID=57926 RepID=UPI0021767F70|nr:uncharacterized protein LOC126798903 isoform X2 [Potentilla anserina]
MERSFGKVVNANDRDEELALFLEMRRRDKVKEKNGNFLLLPTKTAGDEFDAAPPLEYDKAMYKINGSAAPERRSRVDEFLNSENERSEYDWLITPPATPLFPSLEMEPQKTLVSQIEEPNARDSAPKSRLANTAKMETASDIKVASKQSALPSRGPTAAPRRSATPTGRSTLPSSTKPSRSSTPNSRTTLPSVKPVAPPVRSSTPSRPTVRSSTPTGRASVPASKTTSRSATPTRLPSSSSTPTPSAPPGRSSVSKSAPPSSKNSVPSRGSSPTVKSRSLKSSDMPAISLDAPPNLRTTLPQRPTSASRARPGASSVRSSSAGAVSNGKPRQQSCSPSRGRAAHSNATNGYARQVTSKSSSNDSDDVNPVLMGTQSVERVVNQRKLAPPKQFDHSTQKNPDGKSSSSDSLGFGRTLSKKSFDMAMRHMDIRRSVQDNLHPVLTKVPASSVYSVRTRPTKSKTTNATDSPLATCSNASSEPSVNNISAYFEGCEIEDIDHESEKGNSSPAFEQGR